MLKKLLYLYGWVLVRPRRWFFGNAVFNHNWPNVHWWLVYRFIWPIFEWLYWEGWRNFCSWEGGCRSSYPWFARFVHWIGRTTIGEHISDVECYHCGFEIGNQCDLAEDTTGSTFILKNSGSYGHQDGTTHWFSGETICPICGFRSEYEDSA